MYLFLEIYDEFFDFSVFYDFNNYRYSKQYDSDNKYHLANFQCTKINKKKAQKTKYQTYAQASLKFQKESSNG
jgi:hypothetical protein